MFYLPFKAAGPGACVWFALLEAGGCGPLSWVLSGEFFRTRGDLSQGKGGHGGIAAATDTQGHICMKRTRGGRRKEKGRLEGAAKLNHTHLALSAFQRERFSRAVGISSFHSLMFNHSR